jgi:hypothetical protein
MSRIFDHLDGEPEDRWFSKIARHMRRSPWWSRLPVRDEPKAISGEISGSRCCPRFMWGDGSHDLNCKHAAGVEARGVGAGKAGWE